MAEHDDPGTVQFCLGSLVLQLSVPEFGATLGLYTNEFMEADHFPHLYCHIHRSPSSCWIGLMPTTGIYDPSRSKALALALALRYLHAFLAHTLTGRRESTGVVNTHDAYFLWMAQSSSLTLISQVSQKGIQSMLHMRMIERRRGFEPLQYRLARATDEDDAEDIPDDIPAFQEDPPSQPPLSHRQVHAAASLSDVSDHLHRFEQYCTQRFTRFSQWVLLRNKQTIFHDCHVLLDHDHSHHDNFFVGHCDCGTQTSTITFTSIYMSHTHHFQCL
ncbi:hypothetical protein GOBAR_AA17974 [Gossypium barbadense]|uniref:Uncharacterized protein n=1 Tax=Gossypium barbadense TaxID=3634 RepID=A0A2P5XH46_GOSBA|nr:hypothetical protein GOBAR_AA17974 [Gossypium barbadense]